MSAEESRAAHAGSAPRGLLLDLVLELTLVAGVLLILARVLLRGIWRPGGAWWWLALAVASLLALRVARAQLRGARSGRRPGTWLAGLRAPALVLGGCFLLAVAFLPPAGTTLGADGDKYLEQMTDMFLGGRFTTHLGIEPGVVVLQAPFFLLGHVVAVVRSATSGQGAADGSSLEYQNALRLGSVVYGLLAATFAWVACRRFFPPLFSAVCVGGVWLSSTLFYYSVTASGMAHAPAAALAGLVLLLWLQTRDAPHQPGRWLAAASASGLLFATQRYDAYLALPIVLTGASVLWARWQTGVAVIRRRTLLALLGIAAAFLLATLPLVLLSFAAPGGFLLDPGASPGALLGDWNRPHVAGVLFSSNRGFFSWTPVALLGTLGLVIFTRRERRIGLVLLATLGLGVLVLASNPQWSAGWAFGARRLTEAFAIIAVGFCAFASAAVRRPLVLGLVALGSLVATNLSLSAQYHRGELAPSDGVSFTEAMQGVVADVYRLVGHPPSWPANWLFAARYGTSPDRFDDLYGRLPRDQWVVRVGTPEDAAVVGRGWASPRDRGLGRHRWALGADATLLFTLPPAVDRRLELRAAAARRSDGRVQELVVEVNGTPARSVTLGTEPGDVHLILPAALWSEGLNEVRFLPSWTLSRDEAWETSQPPYAAWRLEEIRLTPAATADTAG